MRKELWLVRHGAADGNDAGRLLGWQDPPLNALGRRQARQLRAQLAGFRFDGVWSSDLRRAVETARLAYGDPQTDALLRELDFGLLGGCTWQDLDEATQQALVAFDTFAAPQGEGVQDLRTRVNDFLDRLVPGRHLVFTHGGVIRLLVREHGRDAPALPCEVVRLTVATAKALSPMDGS